MLLQLTIADFAIISHLEIHFRAGLNILTGETGAGKSIIINAVNLILGGRASSDLIRSGRDEAKVEALFSLPQHPEIHAILSDLGLPFQGELVIKRHISREGRNRIMINGSLATLQMLSRVGIALISISGQHEHQVLLRPDNHVYLLDDFGGLTQERLALNAAFAAFQSQKEARDSLAKEIRESEEKQELARFQVDEIEKAGLKEAEDSLLLEEKRRLQHANQLMEAVKEAYQTLYEKEGAVLSELSLSIKFLEKGAEFDPHLRPLLDTLHSARIGIDETALELRDLQRTILIDPRRLEEVEERLQLIHRLKRKYGSSLDEIRKFRERVSQMVENLDQKKEELKTVQERLAAMKNELIAKADLLSSKRKEIAHDFEEAVKRELDLLEMAGTRFEVRFIQDTVPHEDHPDEKIGALRADGYDRVEFMLSPNIGEALKPLSKIASGGELSRIMLAVKTILARTASVETLVFDEVDSGIGGATAEVVGEKLRSLSRYHQILCITHLPQIASKGATHFLVEKRVMEDRTRTFISELSVEDRVKEIARLLGGKKISQKAMAHAREILG